MGAAQPCGSTGPPPPPAGHKNRGRHGLAVGAVPRKLWKPFPDRGLHVQSPGIHRGSRWDRVAPHNALRWAPPCPRFATRSSQSLRRPGRRGLLGRDPAGFRLRPHHGQPQQRRLQSHAEPCAGADDPGSQVLQRASGHPHVADPGAADRERAAGAGPEFRVRSRGNGHHPQRIRGQRDHDPRSRSQSRRRSHRHQSELWPDDHHLGPAGSA